VTTREGVYIAGDYYALCDICGFKHRRSEMSLDWEGKLVCAKDLDERNPQDYIEPMPEQQNVLDARYAEPVYVTDNQVQPEDL
jgi:hypothetical protein